MDTNHKPDPNAVPPQYPGSGQARVSQPGHFVPVTPGQPVSRQTAQVTGPPIAAASGASGIRPVSYVDPILFATGFFRDRADYDQTVRLAVAKIRSGAIRPRQPDVEEKDKR